MIKDYAKLENVVAMASTVFITGAFLALTTVAVPSFERLIAEAEFNSPPITKLAIDSSPFWNIFGVLAIVGCFFVLRSRKKLGWFLIATAGVALIAIIPFLVQAMYEPIFQYESN
jgi:type II secretory pathway component PulF